MKSRTLILFVSLVATGCSRSNTLLLHTLSTSAAAPEWSATAASQASVDCDVVCRRRRLDLQYAVHVAREIYCYWPEKREETGTDFEVLASDIENHIVSSTTATDFYLALRKWAAAFHDGHVNVSFGGSLVPFQIYTAPIRVALYAPATERERLIVASSDVPAQVMTGDEIVAIDGRPVNAVLNDGEQFASGSTARVRRTAAARRSVNALGDERGLLPLNLKILRGGVPYNSILFRRLAIRAGASTDALAPQASLILGSSFVRAAILPGQIGYLRIDVFLGDRLEEVLDAAMRSLSGARALLIDVRGNGGGLLQGDRIIGRLTDRPIVRFQASERLSPFVIARRPEAFLNLNKQNPLAPFAPWRDKMVEPILDHPFLQKPVAALIDVGCASACDTFISALHVNNLATIMGEPTAGTTGQPLEIELPSSAFKMRYSVERGRAADGAPIEGRGTEPDVLISAKPEDAGTGRDTQLGEAVRSLVQTLGLTGTSDGDAAIDLAVRSGTSFRASGVDPLD